MRNLLVGTLGVAAFTLGASARAETNTPNPTATYTKGREGRIETVTTTEGTTRYSYFDDGLIREVVHPDGSRDTFDHDEILAAAKLVDRLAREDRQAQAEASVSRTPALQNDGPLQLSANRFGFTGYYFDPETGLYNAKARYYDPQFGRFTSQDDSTFGKIDNPPSLHRYLYAAGNPTRYVDPDGHEFTLNADKKYGPNDVATPVLKGTVSNTDLKQYLAYVEKHGSRAQVIQATLGATGVYSKAFGQEVAKMEAAAIAGTLAAAPVAIAGGSAVAVGAVGGATQGFVSGLLDNASAAEVAVSTAAGAAIGGTLGWAAQKLGTVVYGEASPSVPGAGQGSSTAAKPAFGEPTPLAPSPRGGLPVVAGGSQGADVAMAPAAAPKSGAPGTARAERLAGSKLEHINASIGELHGYEEAISQGHFPIRGPGKTTARGADYVTYDPVQQEVVLWDAKYRGPQGGSVPKTLSSAKMQRWAPEARRAIEALPDSPLKADMLRALEAGQMRGGIFKWPK